MIDELLRGKMTMMIRSLLLPLCLMQLKGVTGTITFRNDRCLVETGAEVKLTWKNTEQVDTELYFGSQAIGTCKPFAELCPILDQHQALYSASIDVSLTGYNLVILTIKNFTASNCGEYTCQELSNASVKDTTTVEHALSYGDSCESCGQCSHSRNMSCSKSSSCKCNKGYTYKDNVCAWPIDQFGKIALGDTAIIVCNITGEFSNPRWDDGSSYVYIDEGKTDFNTATTNSRWSRSDDTKNLIITSFEDSDPRTYRCSITTPTTDSYIAIVTVIIDPPVTYVKNPVVAVQMLVFVLLMNVCTLICFKLEVVIERPKGNWRYVIIWIILIVIGAIGLVGVCVTGVYHVEESYGDGNPNPSYVIALISLAFIVPVEVALIYIVNKKCCGFYKLKKDTKRITDDPEHEKPVEKTGAASTGNRYINQPPLPNIVGQQGPREDLERKPSHL